MELKELDRVIAEYEQAQKNLWEAGVIGLDKSRGGYPTVHLEEKAFKEIFTEYTKGIADGGVLTRLEAEVQRKSSNQLYRCIESKAV